MRLKVLEETFYTAWNGVPDQSCLDTASDRLTCLASNTAYPYITTPIMLLTSAVDSNTFLELCGENMDMAGEWAQELDTVARNMIQVSKSDRRF